MTRAVGLALLLLPWLSQAAAGDSVVPSERVHSHVVVREHSTRESRAVGRLRPGERAEWLGTSERWHLVGFPDGTHGFVSSDWTVVLPSAPVASRPPTAAPPPPVAPSPKRRSFFERLWGRLFPRAPGVDFVIAEPGPGTTVYRNLDPDLPVSGYATAAGGSGRYDVMLVIDTSTSTNEASATDVNGDAATDDEWKGPDSVFLAQIRAAERLIETVARLPGNRGGERIRVGVVTFAGDERYHLRPGDEDFEVTPGSIYVLAGRDAELRAPLTGDYAAILAVLGELARIEPVGMTNFAAGIGRATIELDGLEEWGARSRPRSGAEKLILFLSDGEPMLPFERVKAEESAVEAAKLAAGSNIRVNTFALGKNPVTRMVNDSVKKMAARTDGRFIEMDNPGDIISILYATAFSFVDRVQLINRTTEVETDYIATQIDGSFYGEIPLQEGVNEIEVVARLLDDSHASKTFFIEYENGRPPAELGEQLERVRRENEALIEQIKHELAREMDHARTRERGRQEKIVDVTVEPVEQRKLLQLRVDEAGSE